MSKFVTGILGTAALVVSLGAAQLAVGHDLSGSTAQLAAGQSGNVNRAVKADKAASVVPVAGNTIVSAVNDTSIVTRVPRPTLLREGKATTSRPVACEASASVLTEVAKQMESGRCVT